jgi:hypothetical protein
MKWEDGLASLEFWFLYTNAYKSGHLQKQKTRQRMIIWGPVEPSLVPGDTYSLPFSFFSKHPTTTNTNSSSSSQVSIL